MCHWQVEQVTLGVAKQCTDIEQPEQVGPGLRLMSPARRSSNQRCRVGLTTPVTDKTAAFQVRISGYVRV